MLSGVKPEERGAFELLWSQGERAKSVLLFGVSDSVSHSAVPENSRERFRRPPLMALGSSADQTVSWTCSPDHRLRSAL